MDQEFNLCIHYQLKLLDLQAGAMWDYNNWMTNNNNISPMFLYCYWRPLLIFKICILNILID